MLCVSEMAEPLSSDDLRDMLSSSAHSSDVIIIDCRPFLVVNTNRIIGANDVHCPPIVKRRSQGNIPLENILRNSDARKCFLEGKFTCIVVYDDATQCLSELAKDSNMYLTIKTLKEERGVENVYFLQGGFQDFQLHCQNLCSSTGSSSTPMSLTEQPMMSSSAMSNGYHANPLLRESMWCCNTTRDQEGPVEVLPWLYIGNLHHALQVDQLLKLGITALINMAASTETSPLPNPHISYKNIPVRDSCSADIIQWFPDVIEFIDNVKRKRGRVLVHCQAGISRSATICIAYLMYHQGLSVEQAFDFLKAKRSVISPNLNFMTQLTEFEAELKLRAKNVPAAPSPKMTLNLLGDSHSCSSALSSTLSLPLIPCTKQAAFAFDLPCEPTTACSPTLPMPSPLMSPS